jgi:ABC-type polysaccharide/polyol phosphate export permease
MTVSSESWTAYAPLDAGPRAEFEAAVNDMREALRRWRSWRYLAAENVRNRYRRTVLGPWWLTLQMAVFVTGITAVFAQILHEPLRDFLPYVAVGYMTFGLVTGMTRKGAAVFINSSSTMKSSRQPLSGFVLREVAIEFFHFAHNMVLYVLMGAARLVPLSPKLLLALPVLGLIAANGLFVGLWLGPTVARFRDVQPFVNSILGVSIFFSPVLYHPNNLRSLRNAVLAWNPFTYRISAFRAPLIGAPLEKSFYIGLGVVTAVNLVLALAVFTRARSRLPYWVAS